MFISRFVKIGQTFRKLKAYTHPKPNYYCYVSLLPSATRTRLLTYSHIDSLGCNKYCELSVFKANSERDTPPPPAFHIRKCKANNFLVFDCEGLTWLTEKTTEQSCVSSMPRALLQLCMINNDTTMAWATDEQGFHSQQGYHMDQTPKEYSVSRTESHSQLIG
jgi:hypothetical protein